MKTITMMLCRRPELLEGGLTALIRSPEIVEFDKLIISVDEFGEYSMQCFDMAKRAAELMANEGMIDCDIVQHRDNLGIAKHAYWALHNAFEVERSDFNINLEDDALVKPDLLRMMLWWYNNRESYPDSCLMAGCNHRDYGKGQHPEIPEEDPRLIAESPYIPSPFCWGTNKERWPFFKFYWDFKKEYPMGFDWSMTMGMRLKKKVAMHPILSRCQNVGREGGEHESPKTFDETQLGLKYLEDQYSGEYKLVARVDRADLEKLDDWMLKEYASMSEEVKISVEPLPLNLAFDKRLIEGFKRAVEVDGLVRCGCFGDSHKVDAAYSKVHLERGYANPWHIGVFNQVSYPRPDELIQAELELLVFMYGLVVQLKPKLVFESGTNVGLMARALGAGCWANGFGTVTSCEVDEDLVNFAKKLCKHLPVNIEKIPALEHGDLREADLVFIDSSYESRTKEHHLIKSGAVYVYHDSCAEPWIRPELDYELYKVHLDSPRGFTIARKS